MYSETSPIEHLPLVGKYLGDGDVIFIIKNNDNFHTKPVYFDKINFLFFSITLKRTVGGVGKYLTFSQNIYDSISNMK